MNATDLGLVIIPCAIFLLGALWAAGKGVVRVAQYFVRSEEAQKSTATATADIARDLAAYMARTDERFERIDDRFEEHGQKLAVLQWELERSGQRPARQPDTRPAESG